MWQREEPTRRGDPVAFPSRESFLGARSTSVAKKGSPLHAPSFVSHQLL